MEITITLNEAEQQALRQLFDAALRQSGFNALDAVMYFKVKIDEAIKASTLKTSD